MKCIETNHRVQEKKALLWCMSITGLAMFMEFFGGFWTNSLALLSDSAHMFSHLFSLGVSFFAILLAAKEADEARTYGFHRAEILAALFNGFTLILIVLWIVYDGILRFFNPREIATREMLVIAAIGLGVNLLAALILKRVAKRDLNVKSTFLHMLSDTASSVGIILAGILIIYTGKLWWDPLASILVALMIFAWSFKLLKESVHILLESTPKHLSQEKIVAMIKKEMPDIHNIHHIHMWELTSGLCAFTAHVEIEDVTISESETLRQKLNTILRERFSITHTNLQFECRKGDVSPKF